MNLLKTTTLKLIRTNWVIIMVALPILYGLVLYWYLGRYNDLEQAYFMYALFYNCLLPCGIALLVSLYVQYEEQIGHFNHLLQLPRRDKWLITMVFVTWLSVGISTLISCVPLWLLVSSTYNQYIGYYLLFTTLFCLPMIIIMWFVALKINASLCLGMGVLLSLFLILFGANSLGDTIWMYVPLLYGTRYLYVVGRSHEDLFFILGLFVLFCSFLFAALIYWFNRWEGRKINE
ncbi:multidrug ABC transporter permease [Virgibacillus pantothenticus]|uniref:BsaG family lantibiotic immunity ABC transporter permease subunit n=1 Tax=Virgibacillus pantothenticus TaxID=1473 RepID=UPI001B1BCEC0|nr:hypothetical protein [Virgibacillus pantothenticus]MBU8568485.1 hypothetical protein [Virgibacillus pantothenticus]MBU8599917.1 hypothetical protein [Virgibacillus pantothenticus]MBU8636641.1 hypothetical protein [Virgibacillus pantothenticus]MBU8642211.1 hypothetical protein [Virgibacillus pantothenticus]MBU8666279.1 hypothetical protein [Virgibacillus pantothenticus]